MTRRHYLRLLPALFAAPACGQVQPPLPPQPPGLRVIHALVCLCDNEHQNIAKVPEKIGKGRDLVNNLYWGNSEGLAGVFGKAKQWKLLTKAVPDNQSSVLERRVYHHAKQKVVLVADAYAGDVMKSCLSDYADFLASKKPVVVTTDKLTFIAGGQADFVAFIGHNGLMDFRLETPVMAEWAKPKATAAFCCQSRVFFEPFLTQLKAKPYCLTRQNMYPGAFLLRDVLDVWLTGGSPANAVEAASSAYATNQKISLKAARGVFGVSAPSP